MGLVHLDGDPKLICGGVTARVIYDLYEAWLPQMLRPGDILMHDGASVYCTQIVTNLLYRFIECFLVELIIWALYLPDLNPSENLWALLKAEICGLYPELEHTPDTEDTKQALIRAAKEAWQSIDDMILHKLSITMPHRVKAVTEADGWYTKY